MRNSINTVVARESRHTLHGQRLPKVFRAVRRARPVLGYTLRHRARSPGEAHSVQQRS